MSDESRRARPDASAAICTRVSEDQSGETLAACVRRRLDELPWSKAKSLISTGRVLVEGEACFDPARRMRAGESVEVRPHARKKRVLELEEERVVHLDHEIVVVDKPAGLVTVPWDEHEVDSLIARTSARLAALEAKRGGRHGRHGPPQLHVVQRLDKDTSGVMVFARTRGARKALENQLREHSISRVYKAIVWGHPSATTHETFLVPDRGDGRRGSWRGGAGRPPKEAKRAITHVRVIERLRGTTLVACELETGRQHQIRIHLAESGHPLLGDSVYGARGPRAHLDDPGHTSSPVAPRVLLHAEFLAFSHPSSEKRVHFHRPWPADFEAALARLRESTTLS